MKKVYLMLFILIFSTSVFAQSPQSIEGIILDKNNQPLPFASIGIKGTSIGTSANKEGRFVFAIHSQNIADTLYISHIGYKTLYFSLETTKGKSSFILEVQNELLSEITVNALRLTPFDVLTEAVDSTIKKSIYPSILHTYAREFTKKNDQFNYFADALVDYYLPADLAKKHIEVSVPQSRVRKVKVKLDEGFDFNFHSPNDIRSLPDYRDPRKILRYMDKDNCDFKLIEMSGGDSETAIRIQFAPKPNQKKQYHEGNIFIDKQTMIILSFECHIAEGFREFAPSANLFSLTSNLYSRDIYVKNAIISGKCYLRSVRFDGIVAITNRKNVTVNYHFINEMITRKISVDQVKVFDRKERFKFNHLYYLAGSNDGNNFTSPFWKEQNGLLATKEEEDVIEKLERD